MIVSRLPFPIVQAPMGGGVATPELAAAVSEAGGLGFLAPARRRASSLERELRRVRDLTDRPFGVNLWVPANRQHEPGAWAPRRADQPPPVIDPSEPDAHWDAKAALLLHSPPAVVSFSFGLPAPGLVAALREAGAEVWVTAASPDQARLATDLGVDALVLQGAEAAAPTRADPRSELSTVALLRLARHALDLPFIAAGGITDGAAVAAALVATASAVQVGSAFMLAQEAGTGPSQRAALRAAAGSGERQLRQILTPARGGVTAGMLEVGPGGLRLRPSPGGDDSRLYVGQAHALAQELPAAAIVRRLAEEALLALDGAAMRLRSQLDPPG